MPIIYDPTAYAVPTFDELVDEVIGNLQGYTLTPDLVTELSDAVTTTDTTIPIVMPEGGFGTGIIEVGDEQMMVKAVDENAGTATLLSQGRGWRSTPVSEHSLGDTVTVSPLVPRWRVKKAVNDVITQVWPTLFGVASTEFDWVPGPTLAYEIPAAAEVLLDVRYRDQYGNWIKVRRYESARAQNTTDFTTGHSVRILEYPPFGTTLRVTYATRPTGLAVGSASFTDCGLSESAKDAIVYGAMHRLIPALDAGRLSVQYVPADELDQPRQLGSAAALAREFKSLHEAALAKEQQALQNLYPARIHFVSAR